MKRLQPVDELEMPNYGIPEAATYLHVPTSTLRYWLIGTDNEAPLVKLARGGRKPLLSFKNLVECYVLEVIRITHKIHVRTIRYSLKVALEKYPSKHPFADYKLSTMKGKIYLDEEPLTDLSRGGQYVFREFLGASLRRVKRNDKGIAQQLFPFTRPSYLKPDSDVEAPSFIVINPRVAFGLPVLAESRISTAFLASRFRGGDSIPEMAKDYGRSAEEIEEAIIWEKAKQAA